MSLSLSTREQEVLMIGVQGCLQNSDGLKVSSHICNNSNASCSYSPHRFSDHLHDVVLNRQRAPAVSLAQAASSPTQTSSIAHLFTAFSHNPPRTPHPLFPPLHDPLIPLSRSQHHPLTPDAGRRQTSRGACWIQVHRRRR